MLGISSFDRPPLDQHFKLAWQAGSHASLGHGLLVGNWRGRSVPLV